MKKHFSRIFAVLLVVSMLFTQLLVPATAAEVKNCECDAATRTGTKVGVSVEATCTTAAYDTYKCKSCQGIYAVFTAPANGHDEVAHEAKDPTCTEIGWEAYVTCNNCDYTTYKELPMLEHDWSPVEAVDPTCTAEGSVAYEECLLCGAQKGYEAVEKLPHTEGEVVIENIVAAGCETPATEDHVVNCTVCKEELSRETVVTAPAHGHNYLLTDSKPAICMQADGINIYTCEYCRDVKREVIAMPEEHDYRLESTTADCDNAGVEIHRCATCNFVTSKDVPALGHDYAAATCTEPKTCKRCGGTSGNPLGHTYAASDKGTVVAPTCVAEGYTYKTCTRCKEEITVEGSIKPIDPLAHKSVITVAKVEPTCTEVGYSAEMTCAHCEIVLDTVREIPALGHDWGNPSTIKMTCERDGYTIKTCKRCKTNEKYDIVPACGHEIDPTVGHKPATCEVEGYDYHTCLCEFDGVRCSYELKSNFVPALGHDWTDWISVDADIHTRICQYAECDVDGGKVEFADHNIVSHEAKAPTCTEFGWDAYETCTDCDYTTYEEIPAIRHKVEYVDAKEATCTEIGWEDYFYCTRCDLTTYEEIPALGHDIKQYDAKTNCLEDGWNAYEACTRCDYSTQKIIPAIGSHDVIIDEAVQPTYDKTGLTEGSHCGRCDEVLVEQIVIDRIKEVVSFSYEATGLNGSEYTVNSGYVTLNIYMNVESTLARLWGADLTLDFDPNLTLVSVDGCAFEYANNSDVDGNNIKLAQGMNVGSNFKTFEKGEYLFATLTFKVNKDFHSADAMFEIVADECDVVRRDIDNNIDFANELVLDFGIGTDIYVAQLGDANGDGKFTSVDTMSLAQWFANADIDSYEAIYDMNKDGYVDGDDFAILRGAVVRDYSYLED